MSYRKKTAQNSVFTRAISGEFFDSPHPKLVVKAKPKLSAEAGRFFLVKRGDRFP